MPEKTATADPKPAADSAKMVEELMGKAQTQYLAMLTETQNLTLDVYKTAVDTMSKIAIPGMPSMPSVPFATLPSQVVEGAFEFGAAVLENQRAFARKMFEITPS